MLKPSIGSLPFFLLSLTASVSTIMFWMVGSPLYGMLAVTAVELFIFYMFEESIVAAALFVARLFGYFCI